jgi:hypothetical protein
MTRRTQAGRSPDPDQQRQAWLDDEYRYEQRREVPVFRQRPGLHLVTSA